MAEKKPDPVAAAAAALPDLPREGAGDPVFAEPWEAHAFAMTVALYDRGLFSWPEWAAALAQAIQRAQTEGDPDRGDTYYRHWLNALETVVAAKGITATTTLQRYRHAWEHAALRTPHGEPIVLQPQDFTG